MVRAAAASSSRPISSMMITSGMWFSTASIITSCWNSGVATCMRRARPMAGWGMSPSPPISLEVSTTTTRFSFGQHAGRLAQQRGLAHARLAQEQDALARLEQVAHDVDGAIHRPAHAQRQADDVAPPVADARDAVQRPLDPGPVVGGELADAVHHIVDLFARRLPLAESDLAGQKPSLGLAAQVQDDFQQTGILFLLYKSLADGQRQHVPQSV